MSPTTLFLLEGCGQLGLAMNWGDGYVTDHALIQAAGRGFEVMCPHTPCQLGGHGGRYLLAPERSPLCRPCMTWEGSSCKSTSHHGRRLCMEGG